MQKKSSTGRTIDARRRRLEWHLMRYNLTDEILIRALDALDYKKPKGKRRVKAFRLFHGLAGEEPMEAGAIASRFGVTEACVRGWIDSTARRLQNPYTWENIQ